MILGLKYVKRDNNISPNKTKDDEDKGSPSQDGVNLILAAATLLNRQ